MVNPFELTPDDHLSKPLERPIPKRRLGKTNVEVTIFGLGGEGVLRSEGKSKEADLVINTALDLGVNYFESANAYSESESYYGEALKGKRDRVFLASKSHARDKAGALKHLEESLSKMKTDHLDLWQIHDVRSEEDYNMIFAPGGAMEAFVEAREKGLTRFIGVTGHHDPAIIKKCLETFDFDTVLIPVNPAEPHYKCFLEEIVPIAGAKDTGVMGMKLYLRGNWNAPMKLLFCYALSQPISIGVIGCDTPDQVKENAYIASNFMSLKYKEVQRLNQIVAPYARDLMFYKP